MSEYLRIAVKKVRAGDPFSLGVSAALFFGLIFFLAPALLALGVLPKYVLSDYPFLARSLFIAALGIAALLAGYGIPIGRIAAQKAPNVFRNTWDSRRAEIVFFGTLLLGIFTKAVRLAAGGYVHVGVTEFFTSSPFASTVGFLDNFGLIALSLAGVMYYGRLKRGVAGGRWRIYVFGALALEVLYALPSCSRSRVIIPLLIFLIVHSYAFRFDWRWVAFVGVFIILLFPYGSVCGNPAIALPFIGPAPSGAPAALFGLRATASPPFAVQSFVSRMNHTYILSRIVAADMPREHGASFRNFFLSFGPPKFIWKSKPTISSDGNEFGHRIGVLSPEDRTTNIGATHVGDWYINFGLFGVVAGMMFSGAFFRFFYEYTIRESRSPPLAGVFVYSLVWVRLIHGLESTIAPTYAGLVKILIVLFLLHWFMRKGNTVNAEV